MVELRDAIKHPVLHDNIGNIKDPNGEIDGSPSLALFSKNSGMVASSSPEAFFSPLFSCVRFSRLCFTAVVFPLSVFFPFVFSPFAFSLLSFLTLIVASKAVTLGLASGLQTNGMQTATEMAHAYAFDASSTRQSSRWDERIVAIAGVSRYLTGPLSAARPGCHRGLQQSRDKLPWQCHSISQSLPGSAERTRKYRIEKSSSQSPGLRESNHAPAEPGQMKKVQNREVYLTESQPSRKPTMLRPSTGTWYPPSSSRIAGTPGNASRICAPTAS
jgi:hypothetical protein